MGDEDAARPRHRWRGAPIAIAMVALTVLALGRLAYEEVGGGDWFASSAESGRADAAAPGPVSEFVTPDAASGRGTDRDEGVDTRPLSGRLIVLDPGHQLGDVDFPAALRERVAFGDTTERCNTIGNRTADGYPEATLTWRVARTVKRELEQAGAEVLLTRQSNSADRRGPCVEARGRYGNKREPDLKISLHTSSQRRAGSGFEVIAPARQQWTRDTASASKLLARKVVNALRFVGLDPTERVSREGFDVRPGLAVLDLSRMPSVMIELGNMRDRADADLMTSRAGRDTYAAAIVDAVRRFDRRYTGG